MGKFIKHLLMLFGSCLLLVGLLNVTFLGTQPGQKTLRFFLSDKIKEKTGYHASIGRIQGIFPFYLEIQDIALQEEKSNSPSGSPWVEIDTLSCFWSPFAIIRKEIYLSNLQANKVILHSQPKEEKNSSSALSSSSSSSSSSLYITNFTISHLQTETADIHLEGKLYASLRTGDLDASVQLYDHSAPSQNTEFQIRRGASADHDHMLFALTENQDAPLSRFLQLPPHPDTIIKGEVIHDPLMQQTRADIAFAIPENASLETLPPILQGLVGKHPMGKASLMIDEDNTFYLHTIEIQGESIGFSGEITIGEDLIIQNGTFSSHLKKDGFALTAKGSLSGPLQAPNWDLDFQSDFLQIADTPLESIEGHLTAESGLDDGRMEVTAELYGTPVSWDALYTLDQDQTFYIRDLKATLPEGQLNGHLRLFPQNGLLIGSIQGHCRNLTPLSGLAQNHLKGDAEVTLTLSAQPPDSEEFGYPIQSLSLQAKGKKIAFNAIRAERYTLTASLDDILRTPTGTITINTADADYQRWSFKEFSFETTLTKTDSPFQLSAKSNAREDFSFLAKGLYNHSFERQLHLEEFHGKIQKQPFSLENPSTIRYTEEEPLSLTPLHLSIGKGSLDAYLNTTTDDVDLKIDLQDFPSDLIEILIPDISMSGTITGTATLQGPKQDPDGKVSLSLNEGLIREDSSSLKKNKKKDKKKNKDKDKDKNDNNPINGKLKASLANHQMSMHAKLTDSAGPNEISLEIPSWFSWDDSSLHFEQTQPIQGQIRCHGPAPSLLQPFVIDSSRISGQLQVNLDIQGSLQTPIVNGSAILSEGSYESLHTGATFKDIYASCNATGSQIVLETLTANDGKKGSVSASGYIDITPQEGFPYLIDIQLEKTRLLDIDHAEMNGSGQLQLIGNTSKNTLQGELEIGQAEFEIPEHIPKEIPKLKVKYLNALPYKSQISAETIELSNFPMDFDVLISIPSKAYLSGRGLTSEWKGEVSLKGTSNDPMLHGDLKVIQGNFLFAGRQVEVKSGTATVDGHPVKTTKLDVSGELRVDDANITVSLKGPVRELELDFESDTSMSVREILSYALFNKKADEINKWQGLQLAQAVMTVTGTGNAPDILGAIQRGFKLDRLEITNDEDDINDLSIQVGKYLSKRFFVGISKTIDNDKNSIDIEADIAKWVKLKGELSDDSNGKIWLQWKHDY